MKQIYYTQCPIGYGLGASNGFQIKRLTEGYPVTSDFRHLGLKAFIPGTRQMAPAALRYRRDEGGEAEVAFLTPRSHEYETERGPWGRPGGHFAHGLQLGADELAQVASWPAGLYDAPFWVRSDPAPSREPSPPAIVFPPEPDAPRAAFERASRQARHVGRDMLAKLLTALAAVVREGRTLFLIDAPERLAQHVALLTFAFPEPHRRVLTFSTYHDRPEDLPGLRLQGTASAARPNRSVLLSLGILADLEKGAIEPAMAAERWATTFAEWLTNGDETVQHAFAANHRRAIVAYARDPAACWGRDWLDDLADLDSVLTATQGTQDWVRLARLAAWCGRAGLAEEWTEARGPLWWNEHVAGDDHGLAAIMAHLRLPAAWKNRDAGSSWGRAFARACVNQPADVRSAALHDLLSVIGPEHRPRFVRGLLANLPAAASAATLEELSARPDCSPALILPLTIRGAVDSLRSAGSSRSLLQRLLEALAVPAALPAVLDALADAVATTETARTIHAEAEALAEAFERAAAPERAAILSWALVRADAAEWLGPILRSAFADPLNVESWREIRARVPARLAVAFAHVALNVARASTLPDEAFRWAVEETLLTLPENERPHDPAWPGLYLERTRSDLDLIRWLYVRQYLKPGIKGWLNECRQRRELGAEHVLRLDACKEYTRVLRAGDARALLDVRLPIVPPEERGAVLGQILASVDTAATDALDLALDAAREAWPSAFDAGAPGLAGLVRALAVALSPLRDDPHVWLERVADVLRRLGLGDERGFEPHGLAAEILAATVPEEGREFSPWRLRHHVLQSDRAWRTLAIDVRRDVARNPGARVLDALERWDQALEKGLHTARFFEVWLNVCDGTALGFAVASRAAAFKRFDLAWWDHLRHPAARNDLRDAFARLAPMAPLETQALVEVEKWLAPARSLPAGSRESRPHDEAGLAPLAVDPVGPQRAEGAASRLSVLGEHRWACIKALSEFDTHGIEALGRWGRLLQPNLGVHLGHLDESDAYRFLAWLIYRSDEFDEVPIPRLASWLYHAGCADPERVGAWHEELTGLTRVSDAARLARAHLAAELRDELKRVANDERQRRRIS